MTQVVLHIGAFKTGTSFIQNTLFAHRRTLGERGVLVPGPDWAAHVRAVRDLQRRVNTPDATSNGSWHRLVEQCHQWTGDTVVVSMEFLSTASPALIEHAVGTLHPCGIRVVLGARDLTSALPAQWQESLQSGGRTWTLGDYAQSATLSRRDFDDAARHFWNKHHWPTILRRWRRHLPNDNLVLMTVPPRGSPPAELWHRFGRAAGFDAATLDPAPRANESLGAHSLEVLRRINVAARARDATTSGRAVFKNVLSKQVLAAHRGDEPRVVFPEALRPWAVARTGRLVARLRQIDPVVVGSLDDLVPESVGAGGTSAPDSSDPLALLAACRYALGELGASPTSHAGFDPDRDLAEAIAALTQLVLAGN